MALRSVVSQRRLHAWGPTALLALCVPGCGHAPVPEPPGTVEHVGSAACAACHQAEHDAWRGSHHDRAMARPGAASVAGNFATATPHPGEARTEFLRSEEDFTIRTAGPDGELADFEVRYTFGTAPLQQYLLGLPGGRLQAFGMAWDAVDGRWFHLQDADLDPTDVLHWTQPSHNWNTMCADCHSTGVVKGYDPKARTYRTTFAEVSVGCEACHGPGSAHVQAASDERSPTTGILPLRTQPVQINACAGCHSRRGQLAEGFTPGKPFLDHYSPAFLEQGLYHADGQILDEVYVYGSFLQSRMHAAGVACSNCHEPHSARLRAEGNALCVQCHNPAGRADFPTLPKGDYDHRRHHLHGDGGPGSLCVNCHMPARTYMVIDDRRDHSFRVPRPDLAVATQAPDACSACHQDRGSEWAADVLLAAYGTPRDHYGPTIADGRRGLPAAEIPLAAAAGNTDYPALVRATALSLLAGYGREKTLGAVAAGLADPSPLVRIGALRATAAWPPGPLWELAHTLLQDEFLAVRVEAVPLLAPLLVDLAAEQRALLQDGIAEYLDVLAFNADRPESHTNRGNLYVATGEVEKAEAAYAAALERQAQWVPALVNLADLYRASGRDERGGRLLRQASRIAPDLPEVLVAYGMWLVRQDRHPEAVRLFARAAETPRAGDRFAHIYAVALYSTGQPRQALLALDRGIAQRPGDEQLLRTALGIAQELGDKPRADEYLGQLQAASAERPR